MYFSKGTSLRLTSVPEFSELQREPAQAPPRIAASEKKRRYSA